MDTASKLEKGESPKAGKDLERSSKKQKRRGGEKRR